jgi:predicted PurR-regulated permease PerM
MGGNARRRTLSTQVMATTPPADRHTIAAWITAVVLLFLALHLRLLPALLAGLLVYELVHVIALRFTARTGGKLAAVGLIATVIVGALVAAMFGIVAILQGDAGTLPRLLQRMAEIVETSRGKLPPWLVDYLPGDPDAMKSTIVVWLREHATELRTVGGEVGHVIVHVLIGMVIGAMVSLREASRSSAGGPLVVALAERARRLGDAFRNVVFAQIRISALNTVFTALYLLVALPLAGIHLPYAKTLVVVTFIVGLLPVVGNLISNTVIVIVSLSQSLGVAIASLVFLVVIHKLEYFLNARIVGARIHAKAWELLVAMLLMESAFGIAGLVAAPIYYAYLKDELAARKLI